MFTRRNISSSNHFRKQFLRSSFRHYIYTRRNQFLMYFPCHIENCELLDYNKCRSRLVKRWENPILNHFSASNVWQSFNIYKSTSVGRIVCFRFEIEYWQINDKKLWINGNFKISEFKSLFNRNPRFNREPMCEYCRRYWILDLLIILRYQ